MNKCISVGAMVTNLPGQTNNYLATGKNPDGSDWSMVQEFKDLGVTFVKFWVNWFELAQGLGRVPISFDEQAQYMDQSYGLGVPGPLSQPYIRYLDQAIKRANDEGLAVILGMYQNAPTWSWTTDPNPAREPGTEKYASQHFPSSMSANSPYGWFIRYIVARYTGEWSEGPGSGCATKTGNPSNARVACFEPINEPNYEWWPQTGTQNVDRAREAMQTCDFWCSFHAANYGYTPWTLGPATADRPDASYCVSKSVCYPDPGTGRYKKNTGYGDYTNALLAQLQGWQPYGRVYWSHHNYHDIEHHRDYNNSSASAVRLLLAFYDFNISSSDAGRLDLYLTEGTHRVYDMYDINLLPGERDRRLDVQSDNIAFNWNEMKTVGWIKLWTQHTINDSTLNGEDPSYALRERWIDRDADDAVDYNPDGPGAKRPAWTTLKNLTP